MALMKVKGNIERLFDKNLNDLVRGIRNHKEDEGKYIASCLEEIKAELRQHNLSVKTNAVAKLTYLQVGTTRGIVLLDTGTIGVYFHVYIRPAQFFLGFPPQTPQ